MAMLLPADVADCWDGGAVYYGGSFMRISDLGKKSGVPVATIKFYLREHLLPQGTPTGRNQAEYDEGHLQRLRLIRAFTNIGRLDLSSVRALMAAIDDERVSLQALYEMVDRSLFPADPVLSDADEMKAACAEVDGLVDKFGWQVGPDARGRHTLAHVFAALQRLGCDCGVDFFIPYAKAAERLATQELNLLPAELLVADRAAAAVRSVLLEVALSALRRMAQEHFVTERMKGLGTHGQTT
jgi:DNA-binding transcriptional MerR regulator